MHISCPLALYEHLVRDILGRFYAALLDGKSEIGHNDAATLAKLHEMWSLLPEAVPVGAGNLFYLAFRRSRA